jgi:hypothetical protein
MPVIGKKLGNSQPATRAPTMPTMMSETSTSHHLTGQPTRDRTD